MFVRSVHETIAVVFVALLAAAMVVFDACQGGRSFVYSLHRKSGVYQSRALAKSFEAEAILSSPIFNLENNALREYCNRLPLR